MQDSYEKNQPEGSVHPLAETVRSHAEKAEFNEIGKLVSKVDLKSPETLSELGALCWEANAAKTPQEQDTKFKTAAVVIEAIVQRRKLLPLLQLGALAWRGQDHSPISLRLLEAALELGPLEEVYETAQEWLTKPSNAGWPQKRREFSALAIIGTADRGYRGARFCAAELLRDGDCCNTDPAAPRMHFHICAATIIHDCSLNLKLAAEAFEEVLKLTDSKKSQLRNFYLTMSEVARTASIQLSPLAPGEELEVLLGLPETSRLEFKSSARWDYKEGRLNKDLEHSIIKTIAAFTNTDGGVLIIGVSDDKQVLGLEPDYNTFERQPPNQDGFRRYLTELITKEIDASRTPFYSISVITVQNKEVCRIEIESSAEPVFVKRKDKEVLYVRLDNRTEPLTELSKVNAWLKNRDAARTRR